MQNLGIILATLYPNAVPLVDYVVQDDGKGPYIAKWDVAKLGPLPDNTALQGVDADKIVHNKGLDAQIAALEAAKPGYVRGIREFMLGIADGLGAINPALAAQLKATPGMVNVKTLDDQIKALRAGRVP